MLLKNGSMMILNCIHRVDVYYYFYFVVHTKLQKMEALYMDVGTKMEAHCMDVGTKMEAHCMDVGTKMEAHWSLTKIGNTLHGCSVLQGYKK